MRMKVAATVNEKWSSKSPGLDGFSGELLTISGIFPDMTLNSILKGGKIFRMLYRKEGKNN